MKTSNNAPQEKASLPSPFQALLILYLATILAACSSAEQEGPKTNSELATFRLTDVWTETSDQPSAQPTTLVRRRVTFYTRAKDVATTESLQANVGFRVYVGSELKGTPSTTIDGVIKWELEEEFEKDQVLDYRLYEFHIEATPPYSGFRIRRVQVNFQKEGKQAGIDITDGTRSAPLATAPSTKVATFNGTLVNPKPKFFPVSTRVSSHSDVPYAISKATGKRNQLMFKMQTCMLKESENLQKVRTGLNFKIYTDAVFEGEDKKEIITANDGVDAPIVSDGCFYFPIHFKSFSYFAQQAWYPMDTKICSSNDTHGDHCFEYVFYFNPSKRFGIGKQDYVHNQGHAQTQLTNFEPPAEEFIFGSKKFELLAELRKPSIFAKGYSATFLGRTYRIDSDLNMSSVRRYQIVMEPKIKHWTIDNPERLEDLQSGSVNVKLLLRKSHGESIHEFPLSALSEVLRKKEAACFSSKSIFDLLHDQKLREWCYARSYMDHVSRRVKVDQGVVADIFDLEFEDIRYVTSRNILMMELALDRQNLKEDELEIQSKTFISTFSPLKEDAYRRWAKQYDQYFNQESGTRIRIAELDYTDAVSAVYTKSLEDAGLGDAEALQKFLANLPNDVIYATDGMTLNKKMDSNIPYSRQANIIYEALEEQDDEDGVNLPHPESIDEILNIVDQADNRELYSDNYVELRKSAMADSEKNSLPVPINIYRIQNALATKSDHRIAEEFPFSDEDFDIVIASQRPKIRPDQRPSKTQGFLYLYKLEGTGNSAEKSLANPDLKRILESTCDAVYPITHYAEAKKEAKLAAKLAYDRAAEQYKAQQKILCKMHDMISTKLYEGVELNDTKAHSNCEELRPLCIRPMVRFRDTDANWFERRIFGLTGIAGEADTSPELSCDNSLETNDVEQLSKLFRGDLELIESMTAGTMHWLIELLEPVARKWLRHAPFAKVRNEVLRRNNPTMRLDEILVHPDDEPELYEARFLRDRCKRDPFHYLNIDITEHVTALKNKNHERFAKTVDVTNLLVSASITISKSDIEQDSHGTNRSSTVESNIDTAASINGNLFAGLTIAGSGFHTSSSAGSNVSKSVKTYKNWFLIRTHIDSAGMDSNATNATGKTINAEYATFSLDVQTMKCVSFRPKWHTPGANVEKLMHPGFLICGDLKDPRRDDYETIEETWYYTYLYFRNNNSGFTNTASSLVERPWTVMMRGEQLFEKFRDILANESAQIELESQVIPDQRSTLRRAYRVFRDQRGHQFLSSPGLLKRLVIIPQE